VDGEIAANLIGDLQWGFVAAPSAADGRRRFAAVKGKTGVAFRTSRQDLHGRTLEPLEPLEPLNRSLRSTKERGQRQVSHRVEAGRGVKHFGNRVDYDGCRRDGAGDATGNLHREVRRGVELNRVVR